MNSLELSICIPTHNFGPYIGHTLESIIAQRDRRLEVVILDGGSTDSTQTVVEELSTRYPFIRYLRQETARGIDRDLATTVANARGRYCWLMSADDVPMPGSIKRMLEEIASGYDAYLCNRIDCDVALKPVTTRYWLQSNCGDHVVDFLDETQLIRYFDNARSLGAVFSYISSIVFSREKWQTVPSDENFAGTNYMHVNTLLQMLNANGSFKYIRDPLVLCRGGNDSFLGIGHKGIVQRYLIDLDGYSSILSHQNYSPRVHNSAFGVMRWEHPWLLWIRVAIRVDDNEKWSAISNTLRQFGYTPTQLAVVSMIRKIESIAPVISTLRRARRCLAKA